MIKDREKLLRDFPHFYEMIPHFVKSEELKQNCYEFLNFLYQKNYTIIRQWRRDENTLRNKIYEYCYRFQ